MSEILKAYKGKKGEKAFAALSTEKKAEVIKASIMQNIGKELSRQVATATVNGAVIGQNFLYERYVKQIDAEADGSDEKSKLIEKLLSEIREKHLEYVKKFGGMKSEN